ncbi:MAG: hypothetical protein ACRDHL_12265 [Candidatus Promineifilaceae bacterium]
MTATASGLILGFLVATAYGAAFHVLLGGRPRKIALYVLASWLGFTAGHFLGDMANFEPLRLGAIHLFSASLGAWALLIGMWLLSDRPA